MSVRMMSAVWERDDLDSSEKLVLLALADHANDQGTCYPGNTRLAKRTGMTGRGIQKVILRLVEKGLLDVEQSAGMGGANVYHIRMTPEPCSPPNDVHPPELRSPPPRTEFTTPPNHVPSTPEPRSPKPSLTINEPSESPPVSPPKSKRTPKARLPEEWAPSDADREYARSLQLTEANIEEIADEFRAYWNEQTARRTEHGWRRTWQNQCRHVAPQYAKLRRMDGKQNPGGSRPGGSFASIVAGDLLGDQDGVPVPQGPAGIRSRGWG